MGSRLTRKSLFNPAGSKLAKSLDKILPKLDAGKLEIHFPDGTRKILRGSKSGPHAVIIIRNYDLIFRLLQQGEMGFAEAYMDGWWETPDLMATMDLLVLNSNAIRHNLKADRLFVVMERIRHHLRANSKRQARKNIAHHYDLGNEFYALWLDESMTYSSALYREREDTLAQAQAQKYNAVIDQIGIDAGAQVLEVGCGWGGFAEHAAKTRGVRVTGLTISREQHEFAQARIFKAGLNDRVDIKLQDYRDERGSYDGIASIEMFEAVGEENWPVYFNAIHDRLKPNAKATIQTITVHNDRFDNYRKNVDFIQKYIFPGGMLPCISALRTQSKIAMLEEVGLMSFGQGYSQTLRQWFENFNNTWDDILTFGFDDRFRRMWNYYLASCAASFKYETTDVAQITLMKK